MTVLEEGLAAPGWKQGHRELCRDEEVGTRMWEKVTRFSMAGFAVLRRSLMPQTAALASLSPRGGG